LLEEGFVNHHKRDEVSFTRRRKLGFRDVAIFLLRRSVKSLQIILNEFNRREELERVSASAFSQARKKFKHTAFIELLQECVVAPFYADDDYEKFQGYRVLAIDGSSIRLPNTKEIRKEFGQIQNKNRFRTSTHNEAKISVLYDLLNRLPLEGVLSRARTNDAPLAEQHLSCLGRRDLVVLDRGYASYALFAKILEKNAAFIVRCPRRRFGDGAGLFSCATHESKLVNLKPSGKLVNNQTLPSSLQVRFVRLLLPTGEVEVLVTSLLDERLFPVQQISQLYRQRWGVETFFHVLKSRLCLEHFSGRSVEAVRQDFYSTLYLSALESVITADAELSLKRKNTRHRQKVNKAISFHVIKDRALDIVFNNGIPTSTALEQLTSLFLQAPTLIRPLRCNARQQRRNFAYWASLHFHKNLKKQVF
jgi:hypothetical protein